MLRRRPAPIRSICRGWIASRRSLSFCDRPITPRLSWSTRAPLTGNRPPPSQLPRGGAAPQPAAGVGPSVRRILPGEPVDRLPDEVGMADVPGVLLDEVDQDAPQAGCLTAGAAPPGQLPQAAGDQRLADR